MEPLNQLLDPPTVARMLGVHLGSLSRWRMQKRELPFVVVGRLVRYELSAVQDYIAARRQGILPRNSRLQRAG